VDPARPLAPILCAQSWLCRVAVDGGGGAAAAATPNGVPAAAGNGGSAAAKGKAKRKRAASAGEGANVGVEAAARGGGGSNGAAADVSDEPPATNVVRSYGGVLLFSVLAADEAIVVEQPWLRVMDHFPPALYRSRFGT
jgi:hypothetical protein